MNTESRKECEENTNINAVFGAFRDCEEEPAAPLCNPNEAYHLNMCSWKKC